MNEMTMEGFYRLYQSEHAVRAMWMGIEVTIPDAPGTEFIINRRENFEEKMKYYQKAYNENLVHNATDKIRIVGYAFAETLRDLQEELGIY